MGRSIKSKHQFAISLAHNYLLEVCDLLVFVVFTMEVNVGILPDYLLPWALFNVCPVVMSTV